MPDFGFYGIDPWSTGFDFTNFDFSSLYNNNPNLSANEPPPTSAPVPWQKVLSDLAGFLQAGANDWGSQSYGNDQNSYWDDGSNTAPWTFELGNWNFSPQSMGHLGFSYFNYLTQDIDFEFLLSTPGFIFSANLNGLGGSPGSLIGTSLGNNVTQFAIDGITVTGRWHVGQGNPGDPNQIVVNGGHWDFNLGGFNFNSDVIQPNPPPPIGSLPAGLSMTSPIAQLEQQVEAERLSLSQKFHMELAKDPNQLVTFDGPGGTKITFKLSEFVGLLDKYFLVIDTTGKDYTKLSGGSGQVEVLPDGRLRTTMSLAGLSGYMSSVGGLDYLIIHEVAHKLVVAKAFEQMQWNSWVAGGGTGAGFIGNNGTNGSRNLYLSESYVNNITRSLDSLIHIPELASPGGTYSYTGRYN